MKKLRFHLLSLVHLPQSKKYLSCAFTQKNRKLAKMLTDLGHEVFFYGSEGSDVEEYCNSKNLHFIQTHTLADIAKDYGTGDNRFEIGYNWTTTDFKHDFNKEAKPSTLKFYKSCIKHINKIKRPDDFLLCSQGGYHKPIADMVKLFLTCEAGIGYRGSVSSWYRAFESHHIQSFTYGSETPYGDRNGSYYDRVIPNYFDPTDIKYSDKKGDYYLFIGRMIKRKGLLTAYMATKAIGAKLIMVGQGAYIDERGHLVDNHPQEYDIAPDSNWEYQGFADVEKRKELMAHAKAVFVATEYLEIFGGTHIEAMLSGTPVITTDFGVFGGNTFQHGVHGYKCNTLQDFVDAARKVNKLDPVVIRKWAEQFLMGNVALQFDKWFHDLYAVWESATIPGTKGWSRVQLTSKK
jgi:glycosyltransferase involved in cell wall biosynthesis